MKALWILAALAFALVLQATLARFLGGAAFLDLVLLVVVCSALRNGPVTGMLAGSAGGIIQDSLSMGLIGVGGLTKSVVGYVVGTIGQQFNVTAALSRGVLFFASSLAHVVIFAGFYVLLGLEPFGFSWTGVLSQALGNAVVGVVALYVVEVMPMIVGRRQMSKLTRY